MAEQLLLAQAAKQQQSAHHMHRLVAILVRTSVLALTPPHPPNSPSGQYSRAAGQAGGDDARNAPWYVAAAMEAHRALQRLAIVYAHTHTHTALAHALASDSAQNKSEEKMQTAAARERMHYQEEEDQDIGQEEEEKEEEKEEKEEERGGEGGGDEEEGGEGFPQGQCDETLALSFSRCIVRVLAADLHLVMPGTEGLEDVVEDGKEREEGDARAARTDDSARRVYGARAYRRLLHWLMWYGKFLAHGWRRGVVSLTGTVNEMLRRRPYLSAKGAGRCLSGDIWFKGLWKDGGVRKRESRGQGLVGIDGGDTPGDTPGLLTEMITSAMRTRSKLVLREEQVGAVGAAPGEEEEVEEEVGAEVKDVSRILLLMYHPSIGEARLRRVQILHGVEEAWWSLLFLPLGAQYSMADVGQSKRQGRQGRPHSGDARLTTTIAAQVCTVLCGREGLFSEDRGVVGAASRVLSALVSAQPLLASEVVIPRLDKMLQRLESLVHRQDPQHLQHQHAQGLRDQEELTQLSCDEKQARISSGISTVACGGLVEGWRAMARALPMGSNVTCKASYILALAAFDGAYRLDAGINDGEIRHGDRDDWDPPAQGHLGKLILKEAMFPSVYGRKWGKILSRLDALHLAGVRVLSSVSAQPRLSALTAECLVRLAKYNIKVANASELQGRGNKSENLRMEAARILALGREIIDPLHALMHTKADASIGHDLRVDADAGAWALSFALPLLFFMLKENTDRQVGRPEHKKEMSDGTSKDTSGDLSTGDLRKVLQLLSRVMDGGHSDFAAEVVGHGALSSVVSVLSTQDSLFREGVAVFERMVACVAASQEKKEGAKHEDSEGGCASYGNTPCDMMRRIYAPEDWEGGCSSLLHALERGLDCAKAHVRRAVVDALLSLKAAGSYVLDREKSTDKGHRGVIEDCDTGKGNCSIWDLLVAVDCVRTRGLAVRASCDADALVTGAGCELYQHVDMAHKRQKKGARDERQQIQEDDALVRWLMAKVQSVSPHVRTSVSHALGFYFRSTHTAVSHVAPGADTDCDVDCGETSCPVHGSKLDEWRWTWVLGALQEWYKLSRPRVADTSCVRMDTAQMVLPAARELDPSEVLRQRLASDASWSAKAQAPSPLSKPMDLSVLHIKKKEKMAASQPKDTKLHVRLASMQVLRSWAIAQGPYLNHTDIPGEACPTLQLPGDVYSNNTKPHLNLSSNCSDKTVLIARLSTTLEFLLSANGPLRDPNQEVRAAARAAAIAVGEAAGQSTGAAGAIALITLLQSHVAARGKRVKEDGGGGGGNKDKGDDVKSTRENTFYTDSTRSKSDDVKLVGATKEENEGVLSVLAQLAAHLPASDRRIVAIAQTVLAAVASPPSIPKALDTWPSESVSSSSDNCVKRSDQAQLARCLIPLAKSLASSQGEAPDQGLPAHGEHGEHGERGSVDGRVMDLLLSVGQGLGSSSWAREKESQELREATGKKSETGKGAAVVGGWGGGGDHMSTGERRLRSEMIGKILAAESLDVIMGTALALAGITCGLGPSTLSRWGLSTLMQEWLQDSSGLARQRGIMLLSAIASVHARLAEPYVVYMFPLLLQVLADNNRAVRQCGQECLESIVSVLSGSGARCLVPLVLDNLAQASSWRSRALMAKTLGLLVQNRPRQLAGHMSDILSSLAAAAREAHPDVALAAQESLSLVAGLSRCAPIRSVLPMLTAALQGEPGSAAAAVRALLSVEIRGSVDSVALGLVLPPLCECALDGSARTRCSVVAITGALLCRIPADVSSCAGSATGSGRGTASQSELLVQAIARQRGEMLTLLLQGVADIDSSVRDIAAYALCEVVCSQSLSGQSSSGSARARDGGGGGHGPICDEVELWLIAALSSHSSPSLRSGAAKALALLGAHKSEALSCKLLHQLGLLPAHERENGASGVAQSMQVGEDEDYMEGRMKCVSEMCSQWTIDKIQQYLPAFVSCAVEGLGSQTEAQREAAAEAAESLAKILAKLCNDRLSATGGGGGGGASLGGSEVQRESVARQAAASFERALGVIESGFAAVSVKSWRVRQGCLKMMHKLLASFSALLEAAPPKAWRSSVGAGVAGSLGGGMFERLPMSDRQSKSLLAQVFMCRQDPVSDVEDQASRLWRLAVDHAPKATRQILPALLPLVTRSFSLAYVAPAVDGLCGAGKGGEEEVVLSKELWRQHERERGEACMEYLATRFAGFDGASAITHIFPCLLNVSITQLSSSSTLSTSSQSSTSQSSSSQSSCQLSTDSHNSDDSRLVSESGEAARLEALSALVAASSNAQREAYLPVLLPPMAVALSHEKVPLPLQDLCQMLIRFLYFTCVSLLTPVATTTCIRRLMSATVLVLCF